MRDEMILDFLKRMAEGIATMFGKNCEVVIHDMNQKDTPIVYIVNGHISGRKKGEKNKVLGGKGMDQFFDGVDILNCKALLPDKKTIKSSTFHYTSGKYHYAFGINYDYSGLSFAKSVIEDLLSVGQDIDEVIKNASNSEDMLETFFEDALKFVGTPITAMNKSDRIKLIRILDEKGTFTLKKSIPMVSEKLGISRYTIYNYLNEIKESQDLPISQ